MLGGGAEVRAWRSGCARSWAAGTAVAKAEGGLLGGLACSTGDPAFVGLGASASDKRLCKRNSEDAAPRVRRASDKSRGPGLLSRRNPIAFEADGTTALTGEMPRHGTLTGPRTDEPPGR